MFMLDSRVASEKVRCLNLILRRPVWLLRKLRRMRQPATVEVFSYVEPRF